MKQLTLTTIISIYLSTFEYIIMLVTNQQAYNPNAVRTDWLHEYVEAERKHGVSMYVSIVTALLRVPIIQVIALEALQIAT